MAVGNGGTQDHGGGANLWLKLPEDDISNFKKIKSKIFRNIVDPGSRTMEEG